VTFDQDVDPANPPAAPDHERQAAAPFTYRSRRRRAVVGRANPTSSYRSERVFRTRSTSAVTVGRGHRLRRPRSTLSHRPYCLKARARDRETRARLSRSPAGVLGPRPDLPRGPKPKRRRIKCPARGSVTCRAVEPGSIPFVSLRRLRGRSSASRPRITRPWRGAIPVRGPRRRASLQTIQPSPRPIAATRPRFAGRRQLRSPRCGAIRAGSSRLTGPESSSRSRVQIPQWVIGAQSIGPARQLYQVDPIDTVCYQAIRTAQSARPAGSQGRDETPASATLRRERPVDLRPALARRPVSATYRLADGRPTIMRAELESPADRVDPGDQAPRRVGADRRRSLNACVSRTSRPPTRVSPVR